MPVACTPVEARPEDVEFGFTGLLAIGLTDTAAADGLLLAGCELTGLEATDEGSTLELGGVVQLAWPEGATDPEAEGCALAELELVEPQPPCGG